MTDQDSKTADIGNPGEREGPGSLVRDARLRRDMTIEQVAEALHLDRATINRLEADDFQALPPMTFVQGYLRAYCQILELPPEPVLARLAEVAGKDPESPLAPTASAGGFGHRFSRGGYRRAPGIPMLAAGLALLIAILVAGGWWFTQENSGSEGLADQATAIEQDPVVEESVPPETDAVTGSSNQPSLGSESATEAPIQTDPAGEPATESPTQTAPASEPAAEALSDPAPMDEPQSTAETTSDSRPVAEAAAEQQPAPTEQITPPIASTEGLEELRFGFSGDSWMEVSDNRGERLLFGMMSDGEERLVGEPPFSIVIGNTDNVTLEFRDERVDLGALARNKVARFTLGDS